MSPCLTETFATPLGDMLLIARDGVVLLLEFLAAEDRVGREMKRRFGQYHLQPASDPFGLTGRLQAYFAGDLNAIDDIPADGGGTVFERRVWAALRDIACGTITSYGELARRLGNPNATRAVGLANARNPVALIVPCHRVIGANGSLTGYGGGLERKHWLLAHEGALLV